MNERSINRIRKKFIMVAMLSFLFVMLFTGLMINIANILTTRYNVEVMLDFIIDNDGELENLKVEENGSESSSSSIENFQEDHDFSPEFRYSARYFCIFYNSDNSVSEVNTDHIATVSERQAIRFADRVQKGFLTRRFNLNFGKYQDFYYKIGTSSDGRKMIVFLDSSQQVETNNTIIRSTVLICGSGLLITFVFVWIFSSRLIQPEIENMKRQKQFITNASHELKTPLAVIRANTEIEEMMNGENEWTQSTMRQVDRLNGLIQNLVMITRAQEQEDKSVLSSINVTDVINQSLDPYESLAKQDHKTLVRNLAENVTMVADSSKIQQLSTLLIDNAFKYCDPNGTITVSLDTVKKGRTVRLIFSNDYADGANVDYTRFFDRFYRQDQSHTQSSDEDRGGYGIGLSIAESICQSYEGSISVSWKDGVITFTCLLN